MTHSRTKPRASTRTYSLNAKIITVAVLDRISEARGATWAEIDAEAKVWTVPADRMKAGKEHRVPLSSVTPTFSGRERSQAVPRVPTPEYLASAPSPVA